MALTNKQINLINEIVTEGRILTDESDLYSYSFDGSFGTYLPDAVIQTKNVEELSRLVKLANKENIPI